MFGIHVAYFEIAPVNGQVRQCRMADALEEFSHHVGTAVMRAQVGRGASPNLGHFLQEESIYRRTNPEGENAGVTQAALDLGKNLAFVADEPVREKTDKPQSRPIARGRKRGAYAGKHHGPAATLQRVQVTQPRLNIAFCGRYCWAWSEQFGGVGEFDNLKGVALVHVAQ